MLLGVGDDLKVLLNVSTVIMWRYSFPRGSASVGTAATANKVVRAAVWGIWGLLVVSVFPLEAVLETNIKMSTNMLQ